MSESTAFATEPVAEVRFPRTGSNWTPLPQGSKRNRVRAHAVQTIRATPEEVFNTYVSAELLPTWQEGVVSVKRTGKTTLHWTMQDPGTGKQFEFDSEEQEVIPGKRHTSRITSGPFKGTEEIFTLEPHPAGRGTVATLIADYNLPGGWFTKAVSAIISRKPEQIVIENLRHLKELLESGQIPTLEGQPAGRRGISGQLKRVLMGENLPTPPGTRESARPDDLPKRGSGKAITGRNLAIAGLVAVPLVIGTAAWSILSKKD